MIFSINCKSAIRANFSTLKLVRQKTKEKKETKGKPSHCQIHYIYPFYMDKDHLNVKITVQMVPFSEVLNDDSINTDFQKFNPRQFQ